MNGAETLVKTLLASGVDVCFANPGTSEMHFVAALDTHPEMRCILCLFEGGATGAADGYFRMTGKVAATLLHLAPGFGNGFANLHNARKAQSGVLNIMGDHASYHLRHESPLKGDTSGISQAVSHWTRVSQDARSVAADGAAAVQAARARGGQIATLILPANTAWEAAVGREVSAAPPALLRPSDAEIDAAARALCQPGAALLVDGAALWGAAGQVAASIAAKTGCRLLAPCLPARIRRGEGAVRFERLAYVVEENVAALAGITHLVLCGTQRPTSFFAYPGKVSLPAPADACVLELCSSDMDYEATLDALAKVLGADPLPPDALQGIDLPNLPHGPMSLDGIGQALAALLPQDAIVVDEAITNSRFLAAPTVSARGHDWLAVTGGAIGFGQPAALGAAVACPDRKVVVLEGDGSGMYTLQALWTMAREGLDVTVVVFSNRGYQILRGELANVGVTEVGRNAVRMFDVVEPSLDWVALAKGHGVAGVRVTDLDQFSDAFAAAMAQKGPMLIEVIC
ncbi:acetolactate synthase large subunit [Rhodobacter ferrooxidans]|uniref:Thiamine pyrophosphate protein domain protein TPP-binding n=1 Tax=Rhodobacter ferrooxidans TaxID=371731 RepID=C8S2A7_9RHOB|nr:acetolactate synthase large subunit [Rhodobacter sp. SW2]EEW24778.1 thiamine pyrophosphate protein domain protein TPP-binding [Rhodobacter sp. SW2]